MLSLVVFDWNATLLADTQASLDADNRVIRAMGGTPVDMKTYRETFTIPVNEFYVRHGCDPSRLEKESEHVGELFHSYYEKRVNACRTRQGARALLKWLSAQDIPVVLLSNHTIHGIDLQLDRLHLKQYITAVLANKAGDTSLKQRGKKEKLRRYLAKKGIDSLRTVIIGDAPEEVEIGKALGLATIALSGGYYSKRRLEEKNPDYLVGSLPRAHKILKTLNKL